MKKFYPVTAIKAKLHDYKLRHLRIGKVKNLKKEGYTDFKIVNISWDVHWMTNLFLAVIIRDYLRFFIKNTPVIGTQLGKTLVGCTRQRQRRTTQLL